MDNPEHEADLRAKCELAKKTLSSRDKASVLLNVHGKSVTAHVTLEQFEEITRPLFKRTITIMGHVLEDAGLQWSEVDKILLVGGSTRMRGVSRWIRETTGKMPSAELHPDEVVALGAAVQSALCRRDSGELVLASGALLPIVRTTDVNSHSMGVIALNEFDREANSIILPRNSQIPCRASDIFRTVDDYQRQVRVRVTQGEDEALEYVEVIGEATISMPPYPKGAPLEVIFEYDLDGLIRVSVKDLTANRMLDKSFTVFVRKANLLPEVVEQKRVALTKVTVN